MLTGAKRGRGGWGFKKCKQWLTKEEGGGNADNG